MAGAASGRCSSRRWTTPTVLVAPEASATRPARGSAGLLARRPRGGRGAGGHRRGRAVGDVAAQRARDRWERASREGGPSGEAADRDLDAVVALFETAARFCDRLPGAGPEVFLDHLLGQQIPGDEPAGRAVGERGGPGPHRARQQGPGVGRRVRRRRPGRHLARSADARLAPGLRAAGRTGAARRRADWRPRRDAATLGRLLDEERRLFYVAITRARRALVVTAVTSEREALSPSRFLDEIDPLAGDDPRPLTPVRRPLSLTSLVAELRQSVTDPDVDDALRAAPRPGWPRWPRPVPAAPTRTRGGDSRRCPTSDRSAPRTSRSP